MADSFAKIFTEHSPYHYGYNNPVMFSDPSGLAPEKETKVMSTSPDLIGGSVEQGYWNEITVSVYMGEHNKALDDPLGPRTKLMQDFSFLDWVDASGEGGLSSANMVNDFGSSAGRASNKKETTTTLVERPAATVKKSVEQQKGLELNMNVEPSQERMNQLLENFQARFFRITRFALSSSE